MRLGGDIGADEAGFEGGICGFQHLDHADI
jgi:hypothetical protein